MNAKQNSWFWILVAVVTTHICLLFALPHLVQAIAALVLAGFLPGFLLVTLLVGRNEAPPSRWETLLYATGAGYGMMVVGMLLISYLPGGVTQLQVLLVFDGLMAFLSVVVWWRTRGVGRGAWGEEQPATRHLPPATRITGFLVLLIVAGFLRFTNLGYTDYQGDEARAALRAAAVIQGYEDVLLLHKKGPTEILLPTLIYAATGHLTETTARLPFALANLVALLAVWLLGWRLFHPLAGWIAAIFLALDGYFIGFARIVQYQSIVFLTSILALLAVYRLLRQPKALTGYLTLAAICLATGILSHYEGALALLPVFYLWGLLLWQNRLRWRAITGATLCAVAVGGALLSLFYMPYILNPRFAATYFYLTDRRIGGSPPYNNLQDVFLRTTLYSTTYYVLLVIGLTVAGIIRAFSRSLNRYVTTGLILFTLLLVGITLVYPGWLIVNGRDWLALPFGLLLGAVILLPPMRHEERMLWLWFGGVMVLALFLTEKPRTHVYTFFMPWLLLAGEVLAAGWVLVRQRIGLPRAAVMGALAGAVMIVLFGNYAYWFFVSQNEVMLNYYEERPAGYWVTYTQPDDKARFGFPLNNGWKVIGELYAQKVISGSYETSEKEAWVPAWYTRGQERCPREAQWFFEIENLEPFTFEDRLTMEHYLRNGFVKWGKVQVNGQDKLIIYRRTGERLENPVHMPNDDLPVFRFEEYAAAFDAQALPDLPLTYPVVDPPIAHPLHVNFGNQIWLEGYDLVHPSPLRPGDNIRLTLYWRAQQPISENYKVFNQVYAPGGPMQAQRDGYPVCDWRATWQWDPGELITDFYDLPVLPTASDGLYPLYTGFYLEATGERLAVLDENGNQVETQVHLADIRIGVE